LDVTIVLNNTTTESRVHATAERVEAVITDKSKEAVDAFGELTESQQRSYATELWNLGLLATRFAQRRAEESRLVDIGKTMTADLTTALDAVVRRQHEQVEQELQRYFDPDSGELNRRLEGFLAGDGELARVMSGYLAPDSGLLAQTLAKQVGETSPLLKKLSPTDAEGVVQSLKAQLQVALKEANAELGRAMDPLDPNSPVGRFLGVLQVGLKQQEGTLGKQMEVAFKALDANDPKSPISNLVRQSKEASQVLARHTSTNTT
jgi:hypothetical protein